MNWIKRAFSLLVALVVVMIAVSCTTERDAVDKSPELSLDKRLFEGEFFLRTTIFDLPYTVDYSFIGESSDGKVIKWKITENWLIAYSVSGTNCLQLTPTKQLMSMKHPYMHILSLCIMTLFRVKIRQQVKQFLFSLLTLTDRGRKEDILQLA
jgi:hypothetical protein